MLDCYQSQPCDFATTASKPIAPYPVLLLELKLVASHHLGMPGG